MSTLIDWPLIDTVLLDMDGTLLDLNFDNHFWLQHLPRRYAQHHGLDPEQARRHLYRRFDAERGTINWYCLDYWSNELAMDIAQLKEEVAHLVAVHPNVIAFLGALRASRRRAVMVTNAHHKSLQLKLRHTDLGDHLDAVICAHDLGLPKEEPAFWPALQHHEDYNPERTLLIDDNIDVLRAAQHGGIGHLLAMARPDSRKPVQATEEFAAIEHFSEIMPPAGH